MHQPKLAGFLQSAFGVQATPIINFLEKGFSPTGELYVFAVFLYVARGRQPSERVEKADKALEACQAEWEQVWVHQSLEFRGDLDAPFEAGAQNRMAFARIYKCLVISNPCEKGTNIPKGAFIAKTGKSVYHFGPLEGDGLRSITKEGKELGYPRWEVVFAGEGAGMMCLAPELEHCFVTSRVESITLE